MLTGNTGRGIKGRQHFTQIIGQLPRGRIKGLHRIPSRPEFIPTSQTRWPARNSALIPAQERMRAYIRTAGQSTLYRLPLKAVLAMDALAPSA